MNMMDQFRVCYIPGGMSLNHSGWWLCHTVYCRDGATVDVPFRFLKKADY
jgi:hypothetical protein